MEVQDFRYSHFSGVKILCFFHKVHNEYIIGGQKVMYVSSDALSHRLITYEQMFLLNLCEGGRGLSCWTNCRWITICTYPVSGSFYFTWRCSWTLYFLVKMAGTKVGRLRLSVVHVKVYHMYMKYFSVCWIFNVHKTCKICCQFLTWCSMGDINILNCLAAACFLQWNVQITKKAYIFTFLLAV